MATLPRPGAVTLLDFARSIDPNGNTATVVELLNQSNEVLTDMKWIEGNLPTGHQTTVRTGLPAVVWRRLYKGVPASKSQRAQVVDTCGMLEARSEVDQAVAELNGNTPEFRLSEADAFLESMNQAFVQTLFYGDTTINPERFTGLSPRYSSLSAGNGTNIVDAGGTGSDNTSVWLIVWGENTVAGIFPKGSKAGITHEDLGLTATAISTNVLDLNGATNSNVPLLQNIGNGHEAVYLVVQTATTITDTGSDATLTVTLESDSTANLATSPTVHLSTGALAFASFANAGSVIFAGALPLGNYERYLGVRYTVASGPFTAGAINAFLTLDVQRYEYYASGFSVQ